MITRSLSLLGASLLAVLVAACGDDGGNNNNNSVCGDSSVTGSEQCDDGNTANGDGCSQSCQNETPGPRCGDSTIDVATEQCDDGNMTSGDGCSATCQTETPALCGNGAINGTEACDDGDKMSGDGCSATCTVETGYTCTGTPSVCTMTPAATGTCANPTTIVLTGTTMMTGTSMGDTSAMGATNQIPEGMCDGFNGEGGGNDRIMKFTTTDVRDVKIVVSSGAMFDTIVRMMSSPCDPMTEIIDVVGDDGCSDFGLDGEDEELEYLALPAGTYYIAVEGYDDMEAGTYTVTVTANTSTCGNGSLQMGESCDDGDSMSGDGCSAMCGIETGYTCRQTMGPSMPTECRMIACGNGWREANEACDDMNLVAADGCSATCTVETGFVCNSAEPSRCAAPGCGNGVYEPMTEECDDANVVAGDRCSATCVLEADVTEVEPNDATGQVITPANHIIRGALTAGDSDLYTFTLTAPSNVEVELYDVINGVADYTGVGSNLALDCYLNDSILAIYDSTGDPTDDLSSAIIGDDEDGDISCSYIGPGDSADSPVETGADPNQGKNLPAGTYTLRVVDFNGDPQTRYLVDLKISPAAVTPVAPAAGDIIINEFLAADGGATNGGVDSNCDGSLTDTADEFIELVNVSNKMLDLTGLTIRDGGAPTANPPIPPVLQFTFAAGATGTGSLTLAPGKAITVWGGGTPMCAGVTNWFTAAAGQNSLSLNDAGDSITLATGGATPVMIATVTYGASTIANSQNLNPDGMTGTTYALHNAVTGAVGNLSPGKKANGTAY